MGIQPLQDWVLIEPSEAKEKTAGGLFIPDTAKEKPVEGKVLAVGKGRLETPEKNRGSKPKEKEEKVFKTTVLKPGRTLEILATNTLASGFMASPAVAGKAFFLRTKTHLNRIESMEADEGVRALSR